MFKWKSQKKSKSRYFVDSSCRIFFSLPHYLCFASGSRPTGDTKRGRIASGRESCATSNLWIHLLWKIRSSQNNFKHFQTYFIFALSICCSHVKGDLQVWFEITVPKVVQVAFLFKLIKLWYQFPISHLPIFYIKNNLMTWRPDV